MRARRLGAIAEAQYGTGERAGAAGTFAEALEAAREAANAFDRLSSTVDICRVSSA